MGGEGIYSPLHAGEWSIKLVHQPRFLHVSKLGLIQYVSEAFNHCSPLFSCGI